MSRVVILNGPPGCGKDTIGALAANDWGFTVLSFKEPMYAIAAATLGIDLDEFKRSYTDREWKERKQPAWGNKSVRDLMISISEDYIKPFFGDDYFGRNLSYQMFKMQPYVRDFIVTDGGFFSEVDALVKDGIQVFVVHMFRDGCTFEGDSRDYISHPGAITIELHNNGTVEKTLENLTRMLIKHGLPVSFRNLPTTI